MTYEKFWLEDPKYLFSILKIIPKDDMTLESQMNCLSRLVLLVSLILYLVNYKQTFLFMLLSLFFIIILYYLQKSKMTIHENFEGVGNMSNMSNMSKVNNVSNMSTKRYKKERVNGRFNDNRQNYRENYREKYREKYRENYVDLNRTNRVNNLNNINNINNNINMSSGLPNSNYIYKVENLYNDFISKDRYTFDKFPSYYSQQIEKATAVNPDQSFVSKNQKMVGGANPKTKIRPVVAPPSHDWEYWRGNDFVIPNNINDRSVQDYYSSGYYIDEDVECPRERLVVQRQESVIENFEPPRNGHQARKNMIKENYNYNSVSATSKSSNNYLSASGESGEESKCKTCTGGPYELPPKNFKKENGDFKKMEQNIPPESEKRYTGDINDACGYDQTNLYYNLPSNYNATNCQRRSNLKDLNGQIFTSTILPGTYYKNEIIEPINSNIGISFTQQIPPRKVSYDSEGNKIYTAVDPRVYTPDERVNKEIDVPSNYDVYDPRSNGYGTSYRSYVDKLTGQPRFYYDDIDSIRRPNYLCRSEIDFLDKADTYGPIKEDQEEIDITENVRKNAEYAYTDNMLEFRSDMMTRLMRKKNSELWQTRMAPKIGLKKI